jgi:hypothetical protein
MPTQRDTVILDVLVTNTKLGTRTASIDKLGKFGLHMLQKQNCVSAGSFQESVNGWWIDSG